MPRSLLSPPILILIAGNLFPIYGVVALRWDAFLLVMLYWLETCVLAFWTLIRIALLSPPRDSSMRRDRGDPAPPWALAVAHLTLIGVLMWMYLRVLWALFGEPWNARVSGLSDFVREIVIGTGLWLPLLLIFVAHGAPVLFDLVRARMTGFVPSYARAADRLYGRIIAIQLTIALGLLLAGIVFADSSGFSIYVVLILVKTAIDLYAELTRPPEAPAA